MNRIIVCDEKQIEALSKQINQELKENYIKLKKASMNLRAAQNEYMSDRGNNSLGKIVAEKASELDEILAECDILS